MLLVLIIAAGLVCGALFLLAQVVTLPARERASSLERAANYGRQRRGFAFGREDFRERAVVPLVTWIANAMLRLSPRTTIESVSLKLVGAGLGKSVSPVGFLATKGVLASTGLLLGVLVGASVRGAAGAVAFGLILLGLGYLVPELVLTMRVRARKERIRSELPDALDLLAVSVEAGLGFDGAITKLAERMPGPLAEELTLALSEMRIGESRENALKKLADRVDVAEVGSFVRAIVQADQLGMSLGRILRVQAADSRLRRQAAAEEKAMKAPIKMLFPTVLFIFPAMFLVILGPALLNLLKVF